MQKSEEKQGDGGIQGDGESRSGGPDLRSVFSVGLLTLLSRVLGLVREATRAFFLGTGMAADVFQLAFQIPNMLRSMVAEGAVSSAVVPVLTRYVHGSDRKALESVREKYLFAWFILVVTATLGGIVFAGYLLSVVLSSTRVSEPGKFALTVELTRIMFWYLCFVGLAASLQGILHAHGRFRGAAFSPVLFNLAFIATGWLVAPYFPGDEVYVFSGAVVVGGTLQFVLLATLVWRMGVRPRIRWPFANSGVREICKLLIPVVFGAGIYQLNMFISTLLAWRFDNDGYVYVADWGNERVQIFDSSGNFVTKYRGESGMSKWAEDYFKANTLEFEERQKADLEPEPNGHPLEYVREQSAAVEKLFWGPTSVRLDDEGSMYIVESCRHRIQVYNPEPSRASPIPSLRS